MRLEGQHVLSFMSVNYGADSCVLDIGVEGIFAE